MMNNSNNRVFKDELTDVWFKMGIVFGASLLVFVLIFLFFGDKLAFGPIKCGFLTVTNLYCPGCGGTRAFYYLVHGRIYQSFITNPFVLYTIVDYVIFMINTVLVKKTQRIGFSKFPITITIYVGIGILILQCIVRNILYAGWDITCL